MMAAESPKTPRRRPVRAARADVLWRHLAEREECIEGAIKLEPEHEVLRERIARSPELIGIVAARHMHGDRLATMPAKDRDHWIALFVKHDALSVRAVTGYLVNDEEGWTAAQVEDALDDLVVDGAIRLSPEYSGCQVCIELLKRPDDEAEVQR